MDRIIIGELLILTVNQRRRIEQFRRWKRPSPNVQVTKASVEAAQKVIPTEFALTIKAEA